MNKLLNVVGTIAFSFSVGWMSAASAESIGDDVKIEVSPDAWSCFPVEYIASIRVLADFFDFGIGFEVSVTDGAPLLAGEEIRTFCMSYYQEWEQVGFETLFEKYPDSFPIHVLNFHFSDFYLTFLKQEVWDAIIEELDKQGDRRTGFFFKGANVYQIGAVASVCSELRELRDDYPAVCNYDELQFRLAEAVAKFHDLAGRADVHEDSLKMLGKQVAEGIAMFEAAPRWP